MSNSGDVTDPVFRRALEERLRAELATAQEEYEQAKIESRGLLERSNALGLGTPAGMESLRKATALQQRTLERYAQALQAFTDVIAHGKSRDT